MSRVAKKKTTPRASATKPETAPRKPRAKSQKTVVKEIRKRVEDKLANEVHKASLGDYIRLVALEKELKESEPKEIKVTWVDPPEE